MAIDIVPFSQSIAQSLVDSGELFPVDFELAWQWLGYSSKQACRKKLTRNFDAGTDYLSKWMSVAHSNGLTASRTEQIFLTIDCFKSLGMMAGTEQGKVIRKYFLECERIVKEVIPAQSGRIRELELELELTKAKTYYMDRRDAIRLIHGAEVLALLDGRPDIVIEKVEKVTETIICKNGRNVSFEGRSTAELGKELGFKSGRELERWLEKNGHSHLVCQGLRVNQASYIPTENLKEVKQLFSKARNRQLLIGE